MTDSVAREKETGVSLEKEKALRKKPATVGFVMELMSSVLADHIKKREALLQGRAVHLNRYMKSLEARLTTLESRPQFDYRGVWSEHETYYEADFTTYNGSMWFCRKSTRAKPGTDKTAWTLCVKRGADGRDVRDGK